MAVKVLCNFETCLTNCNIFYYVMESCNSWRVVMLTLFAEKCTLFWLLSMLLTILTSNLFADMSRQAPPRQVALLTGHQLAFSLRPIDHSLNSMGIIERTLDPWAAVVSCRLCSETLLCYWACLVSQWFRILWTRVLHCSTQEYTSTTCKLQEWSGSEPWSKISRR